MSGPLPNKERTRLDDIEVSEEVDKLFEEANKPYDYTEIMTMAESKGLFRKADHREVSILVLTRIKNEIEGRMRINNGLS